MRSKIFALLVVAVLATSILPLGAQASHEKETENQTNSTEIFEKEKDIPTGIQLLRTPSEVCNWQTALIFAKVPGDHDVSLEVGINTQATVDSSLTWWVDYSDSWSTLYSVPMIPMGLNSEWYVSAIPGLFAISGKWEGLIQTITWNMSNSVAYTLKIDDATTQYSGSYTIKEAEISEQLPPLLYAIDYNVLNDITILQETLGLGPKGWTVNANQQFKTLIFAMDNTGFDTVNDIAFNYRVNGGIWQQATVEEDTGLMGAVETTISTINNIIGTINVWDIWDVVPDIPTLLLPILTATATIPGKPAGSYVEFYANATDKDDNMGASPIGFYYVDNEQSTTKILSIDPNLYLWLFQENLQHFTSIAQNNSAYQIPAEVIGNLTGVNEVAGIIEKYGIVPFRHWEYLGDYDIYITRPSKNVKGVLDTFQPDVIFLSNLWLGAQGLGTDITAPWDWDLKDINVEGKTLMQHIIDYTKNNHAGLIATHGTLSDWKIWIDSQQYKVGTRGHVGDSLSDINVLDEKTIAAMLGMPEITLWEYGRDQLAQILVQSPEPLTHILGLLIGSTPLQVPYIPFNGIMRATPEADNITWSIPDEFNINIPSIYNEFGFNAYTQVGWQLGCPRAIAYVAWQKALEALPEAQRLYEKIANLSENITNEFISYINITTGLDTSLTGGLEELYRSLISADISGYDFNLSIDPSKFNADISEFYNLTINLAQQAYEALLQFLPTRLVAMSDNGLAGIITHDKYWDPNGYRSVYFSFEIEAAQGTTAENLLKGAVEWAKSWQYQNITELLGGKLRIEKGLAQNFTKNFTKMSGTYYTEYSLILTDEGTTILDLSILPSKSLSMIIAHPTTDKINVTIIDGKDAVDVENMLFEGGIYTDEIGAHLTQIIIIASNTGGNIKLGITADDADSSINPAYIKAKMNVKPTVEIWQPDTLLEPWFGTIFTGTRTISGYAYDSDGNISSVLVKIDDGEWQTAEGTESWLFSWDTTEISDGNYRIYVKSFDGTVFSDLDYVDVIVDNTAPTGTIIINAADVYATETSVTLTISASDANGVAEMIVSNNPDFSGAFWEYLENINIKEGFSKGWYLSAGDGTKTVYVKFRDNAGIESQVYSDQIILDTTPPTVTIVEKSKTTNKNSFTMSWSTTANDIQYYEISTNGITWTNIGTTTSHTFTLSKGSNTLCVRGIDNAGNTGSSESIVVTYKLEEKGFIPGFEATYIIMMLGVCVLLLKRRKK